MWIYDSEIRKQAEEMRARELRRLAGVIGRFVNSRIIEPALVWYRRQRMFEELNHLDDRMLADIGLNRYDIPAICHAAYATQDGTRIGSAVVPTKAANDAGQGTRPLAA